MILFHFSHLTKKINTLNCFMVVEFVVIMLVVTIMLMRKAQSGTSWRVLMIHLSIILNLY